MDGQSNPVAKSLPVSVIHPFGEPSGEAKRLEQWIVGQIRVPRTFDLNKREIQHSVFVADTPEVIESVIAAYEAAAGEAQNEHNIDALRHAAASPEKYTVLVDMEARSLSGFLVLRRSIEYLAAADGTPLVVRMIHDAAANFGEAGLDQMKLICGFGAMSDVNALHENISEIAGQIVEKLVIDENIEESHPFLTTRSLRIEAHVRGGLGVEDDQIQAIGGLIELYTGVANQINETDQTAGPAYVLGPFYPGTWFESHGAPRGHDTRDDLLKREILRKASLIAHSELRRMTANGPATVESRYNPDLVASFALPGTMSAGSFAMGAWLPHPIEVFGEPTADPRVAYIHLYEKGSMDNSALFSFERTLHLNVASGKMAPLLLDLCVTHYMAEEVDIDDDRNILVAEVIQNQIVADLYSLSSNLAAVEGEIQVRIRVPEFLIAACTHLLDALWRTGAAIVKDHRARHTVARPTIQEKSLKANEGKPYRPKVLYPPLPAPAYFDADAAFHAVLKAIQDLGRDSDEVEVEFIEALRMNDDYPEWTDIIDVDDLESDGIIEPFMLLRAWNDGVAIPVVYSPLSQCKIPIEAFDIANLQRDFAISIERAQEQTSRRRRVVKPKSLNETERLASLVFSSGDIRIAQMKYFALSAEQEPMVFADDLADPSLHEHLRGCSWAYDPKNFLVEPVPGSISFHVAIRDDLRVSDVEVGAPYIIANFLSKRVVKLLDLNEPFADLIDLAALTYVERVTDAKMTKRLMTRNAEIWSFVVRAYGGADVSPEEVLAGINEAIEGAVQGPTGVPVYVAVARVAQAAQSAMRRFKIDPYSE